MVDGWSRSGSNGGFQGGCVQRSDQVSNMVVVSGLRANKTGLLGAWILHGTGIGIGISREQVGQIGLLAAWSLSGAVPEILVKWSFWNFRTVFGNPRRVLGAWILHGARNGIGMSRE